MRKSEIIIFGVIILSFAIGIWAYSQLPENIISHWNAQGEPDGSMPKFWGIFLTPLISLAVLLLFVFIPRLDPLKENIEKFRKYFDIFIVLVALFLFYIFLLTIFWNFGFKFSMSAALAPAFGILFFYAGVLIEKTKRNWFIGIRTPWTLSSDLVWDKTHQLGGKLFKASGLIALLGFFIPDYFVFLLIGPVVLSAVYSVIYSYWEYKKEKKFS